MNQVLVGIAPLCAAAFACGQSFAEPMAQESHQGSLEPSGESPLKEQVHWAEFLGSFDLTWNRLPQTWKEAPFLGNGEQGTMMYQAGPRRVRFDVGCSAAHDHRPANEDDLAEKHVEVLNRGRHFIGHLELHLPANIVGAAGQLSLWDAEASGVLMSAGGSVKWRAFVHATEPVMYFDIQSDGDLVGAAFEFVAEAARSPRALRAKAPRTPSNPGPVLGEQDGIKTSVHNLAAGGQTAVAWRERRVEDRTQLWLSVQHSYPAEDAAARAAAAVSAASGDDLGRWTAAHRQWWHGYYPASFVSTGDGFWDSFYWVQQYKLACATRAGGWIMDNQGPWLQPTAWNATWWNLNVQVAHSGFAAANRRGMGSALSYRLDLCRDNLVLNVAEPYRADSSAIGRSSSGFDLLGHAGQPGTGREGMDPRIGRECGNLLWALHNVDLEYRYFADADLRDRVLYPLLKRAVSYYLHFLEEGSDGLLHLPETYSPEYRRAKDCTYDLDLLAYGAARLIELAGELGIEESDEPLIKEWRRIQETLVPAHVNETGRMIGRGVALKGGHRHWSHLLAIYPLRTLRPESPGDRALIRKSLDHWHSAKRPMAGYSVTGGSCMASILGKGDEALDYIERLRPFLHPNTFYSEAGGLPVIETPLHGATAIQEMLLQSHGARLRVFPGAPGSWPDIQYHRLRGEGAFLVSARREKGACRWVYIEAEAGGRVEVEANIPKPKWAASQGVDVSLGEDGGVLSLAMPPGAWVLLWPEGQGRPRPVIAPIKRRGEAHRFGIGR